MTSTPHDALFKATFSQPERAGELLRSVLTPQLAARIVWSSLQLRDGSHVDAQLRARHSDLLFTARTDAGELSIYFLCEHKSRPEWWIGLALLRYMVDIWFADVRKDRPRRKLTPILPVVVYHGEQGWAVDPEFSTLVDCPLEMPEIWGHVPKFRFVYTDLSVIDADRIRSGGGSAALRATLLALKEARSARSLQALLMGWAAVLNELEREVDGEHALALISRYLVAVREAREFDSIDYHALGLGKTSEAIMTREAYMFEKGVTKGREEAREGQSALLLSMLRSKFSQVPAAIVARVEVADMTALQGWCMRLIAADSLDEVFAATPA